MSPVMNIFSRKFISFGLFALSIAVPFAASADPAATRDDVNSSVQKSHGQEVTIGNFTFEPTTLTVPPGTELTWVNKDDVPHIVIGTDGDSPIKSHPLDTDDRYSVTITKPGTYKYFCSMHPHMTGTIIVQ
jgi:plastocyanin